jgi:hypothetical protein
MTSKYNLDVPPHTDSHYYVIAHSYWVGALEDEFKTSMAFDRIETIGHLFTCQSCGHSVQANANPQLFG